MKKNKKNALRISRPGTKSSMRGLQVDTDYDAQKIIELYIGVESRLAKVSAMIAIGKRLFKKTGIKTRGIPRLGPQKFRS